MLINADVGESDFGSKTDLQLVQHIDIANIALGAHAGCADWSRELCKIAKGEGVRVSLHPGYPDRDGFGRIELSMSWLTLRESLNEQRRVLPEIHCCKFHGAIYNRAIVDHDFANSLAGWCIESEINELLAPAESCLANVAVSRGLTVLREAFADRRYQLEAGRLVLAPRSKAGSVIETTEEAIAQVTEIDSNDRVRLIDGTFQAIQCDTICVHGDNERSVEMAKCLRSWKGRA